MKNYEVTVTTEDIQETWDVEADSADAAEGLALDRFEMEYGSKHQYHEFRIEVTP